jgi:hypothetical protein
MLNNLNPPRRSEISPKIWRGPILIKGLINELTYSENLSPPPKRGIIPPFAKGG